MVGWFAFIAAFLAVVGVALALARRWGRGASEGRFQDPMNEAQSTILRKIWP